MARPEKIRLGDLLVRENLITQDQLEFALERQRSNGHKLGRVLVENGFVSEERISEALAMQLNIPYINLKNYSINPKLVRLLPESQARRFHAIVLEENKGRLLVGMCDPTDFSALDEIARLARREVDVAVVTEGQLLQGIDRGYLRTEEISALARTGENAGKGAFAEFGDLVDSFGTDNPSVAGLLKSLFDDAMRLRATEIHIEPQDRRLMLRLRIDGVLHPQPDADVKMAPALVSRIKLMAGLDISENRLPQSGRVQVSGRDQAVDVRVSLIPTQYGESAVMRLLRRESVMPGLDKLGMLPGMLKRFREIIERGRGMVLVTGPEDSGRTTLLYAALADISSVERKIVTVEDPVEYLMPGINQVQVDERIKLTFPHALRSALLQDPDVIVASAMPDEETAQVAVRAAMTGRLVLSTMFAHDAATAVLTLVEMGIPRFMVASSVQAVIAQRLLRQICGECAEAHVPSAQEGEWLKSKGVPPEKWDGLLQGRGCTQCHGSGYAGRFAVHEMLEMGRDMSEAASGDAIHFMQAARQHLQGRSLLDHALEQMKLGRTTVAEVMRISIQAEE